MIYFILGQIYRTTRVTQCTSRDKQGNKRLMGSNRKTPRVIIKSTINVVTTSYSHASKPILRPFVDSIDLRITFCGIVTHWRQKHVQVLWRYWSVDDVQGVVQDNPSAQWMKGHGKSWKNGDVTTCCLHHFFVFSKGVKLLTLKDGVNTIYQNAIPVVNEVIFSATNMVRCSIVIAPQTITFPTPL